MITIHVKPFLTLDLNCKDRQFEARIFNVNGPYKYDAAIYYNDIFVGNTKQNSIDDIKTTAKQIMIDWVEYNIKREPYFN